MSVTAATTQKFAAPTSVTVSSVTATGATVKFVLPSSDWAATGEHVVVYLASNPGGTPAFSATVTKSPVTVTGLGPSTGYYAEVSVIAVNGHAASGWKVSSRFTTPKAPAPPTPRHIRSQNTVPTSGDVVEAKIWLPSLGNATTFGGSSYPAGTLIDWASMWTDGANSTNGAENWPADTEVDAVETQYGASYVSIHYGSLSKSGGSTGDWTTEPKGWEGSGAIYGTPNSGVPDVQAGWNVVDIEFTSTVANIYYNGELYVTVPASVLSHKPAYLNFGVSGPNGNDSNYPKWPAGPGTEAVQYVEVFS